MTDSATPPPATPPTTPPPGKRPPAKRPTKPATTPPTAKQPIEPATDASPRTSATRRTKLTIGLPARERPAAVDGQDSLRIARRVVELAEDKKAADIVLLDISELTTLADAFVVCSGGSERQLDAIAAGVLEGLREDGVRPIGREGVAASHWVLLDFGGVIVHIFTPPERDFYQLEKHWSEARTVLRVQ